MSGVVILFRGRPSSGKSTLAALLTEFVLAADSYPGLYEDGIFRGMEMKDGIPMIKLAHQWCQSGVEDLMKEAVGIIGVANTFTQRWEMQAYFDMARKWDYRVFVVDLYDGGLDDEKLAARSQHNVPVEAIRRMRSRYEHDWGDANPLSPYGD